VIFAQHGHRLFGSVLSVNAVNPRRSQNTTVTSRRWLSSNESWPSERQSVRDLRRQKTFELADALDFAELFFDALFQRFVPVQELVGLLLHGRMRVANSRPSGRPR